MANTSSEAIFRMHFRNLCSVGQHKDIRAVCGGVGDGKNVILEASGVNSIYMVVITGHEILQLLSHW